MLRIRDWGRHYEINRTRELKQMAWVPVPNKLDGIGLRTLLLHPDGIAHYGCWQLILLFASRCEVRGTLVRDGRAVTARELSVVFGHPAELFDAAIARLRSPEIGWLEDVDDSVDAAIPQHGAGIPQVDAAIPQHGATRVRARERHGTTRNGMEENGGGVTRAEDNSAAAAELRLILEGVARYSASPLQMAKPDATILRRILAKLGPVPVEQFGEHVAALVTAGLPKFRTWGFFLEVADQCRHSAT